MVAAPSCTSDGNSSNSNPHGDRNPHDSSNSNPHGASVERASFRDAVQAAGPDTLQRIVGIRRERPRLVGS